jgi:hypothetical protein
MKTIRTLGLLIISVTLMLSSCAEDMKTAPMTVKLTNTSSTPNKLVKDPMMQKDLGLLTAVNLDIRRCEMHYSTPPHVGWFALPTHVGIYNVLDLSTDATVVLVNETAVPQGDVTQFRWILGPNNSIEIGGTVYPLRVPSGEESGLKINLKDQLHFHSWLTVVLIFDPEHSIVEQGNGEYKLTPVIQVDYIDQL